MNFLYQEQAQTQSSPTSLYYTPWCTFPQCMSSSISSKIKYYDAQTVALAAAHRPPPMVGCFLHLTFSAASLKAIGLDSMNYA